MKRALGMAGAAALLAAVGLGMAPAQAGQHEKETVCHVTGNANSGDSNNRYDWTVGREITVSQSAAEAHMGHGDVMKPASAPNSTYITPEHPWWATLADVDGSITSGNCAFR